MEIVSANLFYFTGKITRFTVEISGCLDVFGTSGCYGAFVLTSMFFVKTQKYQSNLQFPQWGGRTPLILRLSLFRDSCRSKKHWRTGFKAPTHGF